MEYKNQPLIFFDGYCILCSWSVRFVKKRDKRGVFSFIPLQSNEASVLKLLMVQANDLPDSIILLENQKVWQMSDAALRIARKLNFPWNLLYGFIVLPKFLRDAAYKFIASRRYSWFGKRDTCYLDNPPL